jgi:hypothetical protein
MATTASATVTNSAGIDVNMIGVSVVHIKGSPTLRLSMRPHHLKQIGSPKKIDLRGSTRDGLLIAPGTGYKPYKVGANLIYVQISLSVFESRLNDKPRATVWMRPNIFNGHLQLPSMPEAWLNADDEYDRNSNNAIGAHILDAGPITAQLSPFPGDPPATTKSSSIHRVPAPPPIAPPPPATNGNGHHASITAPLPKAQLQYKVPDNIREAEALLAEKIDEVRGILRAMEERTGMQFVLDRNLRVVVNLRTRDK